jgi:hypothetical protein
MTNRWDRRLIQTPYKRKRVLKKSGSGVFTFRSRWCYCAKIITAVAVAFPLVVSCSHLPVARGLGRGDHRLRQARHRAAAAAAAASGAVVAEAADHKRPAFFLFGRAPHLWLRHQEAA